VEGAPLLFRTVQQLLMLRSDVCLGHCLCCLLSTQHCMLNTDTLPVLLHPHVPTCPVCDIRSILFAGES
jgi:hypothetical protein